MAPLTMHVFILKDLIKKISCFGKRPNMLKRLEQASVPRNKFVCYITKWVLFCPRNCMPCDAIV